MDYCVQIYAASVDLSILYLRCHRSIFIHFLFIYLKIVFILTSSATTGENSHITFNQGLYFLPKYLFTSKWNKKGKSILYTFFEEY